MSKELSVPPQAELVNQDFPTISEALMRVSLIQHVLSKIMKKDVHYGASFPGDTKKNLLKPGADSLCMAFQLAPEFEITERDLGGDHREYQVICRLKTQQTGMLVASGVGTASTMESKHRYRNASMKCPKCGAEAIIKGKVEYGGGWVCFKKKNGCGATFKDGDESIEKQERGKVENTDPADQWNTVLKMSKKRAFVDATITATAASDMFTQDAEEFVDHNGEIHSKPETKEAAKPLETAPATGTKPSSFLDFKAAIEGEKDQARVSKLMKDALAAKQKGEITADEYNKLHDIIPF